MHRIRLGYSDSASAFFTAWNRRGIGMDRRVAFLPYLQLRRASGFTTQIAVPHRMFISNSTGIREAGVAGPVSDAEEVLRRAAEMLDELDAGAGTDDPAAVYGRVAEVAARRLAGVRSASVTTWDGRRYATPVATDEAARQADRLQYDSGSGPCITAIRNGGLCHVTDLRDDERWPADTRQAALGYGVAGVLSLRLADGQTTRPAAALNLYAARPDALAAETVQMAVLLGTHARLVLVAADNAVRAANLERSRVTGQQIGAAVGLLMAVKRISHDEARDLLRTTSQQVNRRVSDLAAEVVATGVLPRAKRIGPRSRDQPRDQPKRPEM
jgi:hypothetical protein